MYHLDHVAAVMPKVLFVCLLCKSCSSGSLLVNDTALVFYASQDFQNFFSLANSIFHLCKYVALANILIYNIFAKPFPCRLITS